jgi:tRNA-Thr(GGU) m(6)t(6)A37 methyltransferase TsaA
MEATLQFIGHIETPYNSLDECPGNIEAGGPICRLVIEKEWSNYLFGLEPGMAILILYWFEKADRKRIQQRARGTGQLLGVFALRTPNRPNPIGAAVVNIEKIEDETIYVKGLDCLNGTPLLDIKLANEGI